MFKKGHLSGGALILAALMSLAVMAPGHAGRAEKGIVAEAGAPSEQLLVGLRIGDVLDRGADPQHSPGVNGESKDVAVTEAACNGDPVFSKGSDDYYRSVSVIIDRAYPYYETGWTLEIANGGRLPVRIEGIEMVWDGVTELRDFIRLDRITIHRGGLARSVATWGGLENALREGEIHPGETLAVDFCCYFEEYGGDGRLMPENAWGRVKHLVRFCQDTPGGDDTSVESITPGEGIQPYAPPEEIAIPEEPGVVSPPPAVRRARWPGLPYTGGRIALFICSGVALMAFGMLLRRRR